MVGWAELAGHLIAAFAHAVNEHDHTAAAALPKTADVTAQGRMHNPHPAPSDGIP